MDSDSLCVFTLLTAMFIGAVIGIIMVNNMTKTRGVILQCISADVDVCTCLDLSRIGDVCAER